MDNGKVNYERYLNGDDRGLVEIICEYKDPLILYINGFVNNLSVAEDLAEDTFVKLAVKKPRDKGKASFKTWLYVIARNTAIDFLRKQKRKGEISIDEVAETADENELEVSYFAEERKIAVHKALSTIKEDYRQVIWLTYFEGLSNKETAMVIKKSVHATETLIYRARQALRKELEKGGFVYEDR